MNFDFISKTVLFNGCTPEQTKEVLTCLGAEHRFFKKGSTIFHAGDCVSSFGLVLFGSVNIESDDVWGNKTIIDHVQAGQVFAETYACIVEQALLVNVVACEDTTILFLQTQRLLQPCSCACSHHTLLIKNLLTIASQKNLNLSRRIFHTTSKSIRNRVLSYLSFQSIQQQSNDFIIPFNRQQLADYLSVDRSALSNELSKLQKDGLITVEKNHFILHTDLI